MDQHLAPTLSMDSSTSSPTPDNIPTPVAPIRPNPPTPPAEPKPVVHEENGVIDQDGAVDASAETSLEEPPTLGRQQPIPPASEPMQYRAIGLVRGKYVPSEEQFTRGMLQTEDGLLIDSVLLGRVMSLVKKHLDLEQSHLWVVYPRTREKTNDLHIQIVGVWEPEKLNRLPEREDSEDSEEEALEPLCSPPQEDGYFSIRGEILFHAPEENRVILKVQQLARKPDQQPKAFKLTLQGTLEGKSVGYFWDLHVQRQENQLVVQDGQVIAVVPPKKRGPKRSGRGGPKPFQKKRWSGPKEGNRPIQGSDRPKTASAPPRRDGQPLPKPVKRSKDSPATNPPSTPD